MKLLAVVCLLAIASAGGVTGNIGFNCDTSLNLYTVNTFAVKPWPPYKNVNMSMTMTGTMNQAETLKSMEIFVFFNGITFYHESVAESGSYASGQAATINFQVFLPSIAPSGSYYVQIKLTNTSSQYLNCWQVPFTL